MRHLSRLAPIALLILTGCGATFDVDVESTTTIKSGGLFQNFLSNTFGDFTSIDLSQSQGFKNAGVEKDQVDSVRLSEAVLTIETPADATFEFLDAISFFVEAEGAPKKRLAFKENIPNDAKTVVLDLDDLELAPYVTAPSMKVTTEATAHAPQRDTTIKAKLVFAVDPRIF